jgi:uncharacterized protein YfaS (alpha-2-macroglobulin family)
MSRPYIVCGVTTALACCITILGASVANSLAARSPAKAVGSVNKKVSTQDLGGPDRFLTLVSTDKPIYRAGEKVYVRGIILNAANHKPLPAGQGSGMVAMPTSAVIAIKGPKGDIVSQGSAWAENSVLGFSWDVPEGQAGGEYTLNVTYPWDGNAPAQRKFEIRAYRTPRLKSQITFLRDGYGPGEKVSATLDVKRAEGGVPEGAKVTVIARVDGMEIKGGMGQVDRNGLCRVSFDLPRDIPRGEGTLALIIEDGGVVETASKTIPILLQTVDLQIFPEGGDLIAGYPNRVYVHAEQPNGKPADLVAKLMSKKHARAIAQFKTEHEGRGRFEFTPSADDDYYLALVEPAGIKKMFPLPEVKRTGAVIHTDKDVFDKGQPISLHVGCTQKNFRVTLSKREVELAGEKVDKVAGASLQHVSFSVAPDVDGVLAVTVWGENGAPLAERLIFRQPANPLHISIKPDKKTYIPGERAKLTVKATDSDGKPVAAVVGLTVTDDSVLEMVEKREQAPRLPVMIYLEPEVKDLADAHVYLDSGNPKAPLATDLLLGTQGWRRFALVSLPKFIEAYGDDARRVVALKAQTAQALPAACAAAWGAAPMGFQMAPQRMHIIHGQAKAAEAQLAAMPPPPGVNLVAVDMKAPVHKAMLNKQQTVLAEKEMQDIGFADQLQMAMDNNAVRGKKRMIARGRVAAEPMSNFAYVREFAHEVRKDRKSGDRVDFTETLYWNAGVKTDARTGEATVNFGLNDSVTTFRAFADGFADNGAVGAANVGLESVQPFYAEAKLPLEITAGDKVLLPISLVNATATSLGNAGVNIDLKGDFKLGDLLKSRAEIGAGDRVRWIQPINVGNGNGLKNFALTAKAGQYQDSVTRTISVKPKGFPIEVCYGGIIEPDKPITCTIAIPQNVVTESLASNTAVYPTPLANLTEALQRMIQDPYGCFEQTSSTSYPLTMAQQYFLAHTGVNPKLIEESRQKLDAGYKRLIGFWCPDRGYEWFGHNPGHEALTAFGLLHFNDMSKVRTVDQNMIATTRSWLLKQKDGKGGFTRKVPSMHTWIEDKDDSNAYITWALMETGAPAAEMKPELACLKTSAEASANSYVTALAANALYLAGDKGEATKLMDRLATKQKPDGSVDGIQSSIVGSGGESLQVEGTALATLAWIREPAYTGRVEKSIKFLADSCKAGRYGSTQATVLALRAIVAYDAQRARPKAPGKVRLYVDGQSIGDWVAFSEQTQGAIKLPDMTELLTPGNHKLELRMEGGSPMPYSLAVKYNALTPVSDKECKVDLSVKMAQDKLIEGTATEANATITNRTSDAIPTPVAIVGLPGGLEPRHDQLKELVKKGTIDAYEVLGRDVVLYWRSLPGNAKVEVPLSLIAAVPGSYTGPASRAYLYYTDEHKRWVDGVHVDIAAK